MKNWSRFTCMVCALILLTFAISGTAFAATQTGSLNSDQYVYFDITLPTPQSGMRLTLSTSASSSIYLYSGTDHNSGSQIAASYNQNLHTLLVEPASLSDGASYHVRIYANTNLTYSYTAGLKFISSNLAWDNGTTASAPHAFILVKDTNVAARPVLLSQGFGTSGSLGGGEDAYYRIDLPQNQQGWRLVLATSELDTPRHCLLR